MGKVKGVVNEEIMAKIGKVKRCGKATVFFPYLLEY
jgi:hypothetical protein